MKLEVVAYFKKFMPLIYIVYISVCLLPIIINAFLNELISYFIINIMI